MIDPSGHISHDERLDKYSLTDDVPEYMACAPEADLPNCGDQKLTLAQCLKSCKATKRKDAFAEVTCDAWNSCDMKTVPNKCHCDVGWWIQDKFPDKNPPTKNVKAAEAAK